MTLCLILAVAENGVIGRDGDLPWSLPADLARFKKLTMGHTLIMGRRTWESIGRPLPGRRMIVLSRRPDFEAEGVETAPDLETALDRLPPEAVAFVIGGASLYREALPRADRVYLTRVRAAVPGDTVFSLEALSGWRRTDRESRPADDRHAYALDFEVYEPPSPVSDSGDERPRRG